MKSNAPDSVMTIGHSTHDYVAFRGLLQAAAVSAVADVRSSPYSNQFPHFNRDALQNLLRADGLDYVFLGRELGGRPKSRAYFTDGIADYEKMASSSEFKSGIARLIVGAKRYRIALMCSERSPLDCHRCLLVGRALHEAGLGVGHILPDSQVVSHSELEQRLLALSDKLEADLFASNQERLRIAYRERALKVAFSEELKPVPGIAVE